MRRRRIVIVVATAVAACAIAADALVWSIDRVMEARLGPVHRFTAVAGETFLTDERAVGVARAVMKLDGFPDSGWKLMGDDRTTAPDGRRDRYVVRNADNPNLGTIYFHGDNTPTPQRFVHIEFDNGEITARGEFGK